MHSILNGIIEEVTKQYVKVRASNRYYYFQRKYYPMIFEPFKEENTPLRYKTVITDGEIVLVEKGDKITFVIKDLNEDIPIIVAYDKTDSISKDFEENIRRLIRDIPWSENDFQLGASLLFAPPVNITVEKMSSTQRVPVIRSKTSVKQQSGHTDTKVTMTLYFPDANSINDPRDGLRGILSQFMKTPFVPVINTFLNDVHHIESLCLHDITIHTIPNFPGALQAIITCFAFDHRAFVPQEPYFVNMIDADLFEWYISRGIDSKLKTVTGRDSGLHFYYVPEEQMQEFAQKRFDANQRNVEVGNPLLLRQSYHSMITVTKRDLKTVKECKKAFDEKIGDFVDVRRPIRQYNDPNGYFKIDKIKTRIIVRLKLNNSYNFKGKQDEKFLKLYLGSYSIAMEYRAGEEGQKIEDDYNKLLAEVEKRLEDYEKKAREYTSVGSLGQEWKLSLSPYDLGNVIVTSVSVSYQNVFSRLPVQMLESPTYQFLGSSDIYAQVVLEVLDNESMEKIVSLFEYTQYLARQYRFRVASSFLKVENEVLNLVGMNYVFIDSMSCTPVPNFPGRYIVELNLIDFDLLQSQREQSKAIINTEEGPKLRSILDADFSLPGDSLRLRSGEELAVYWGRVNNILKQINVYPDLDLPTYSEINAFLASIGRGALPNPKKNVYVDPDFYFRGAVGGDILSDSVKKTLENPPSVTLYTADEEEEIKPGQLAPWYKAGSSFSTSPEVWHTGFLKAKDIESQWQNEWHDQINYDCTGRMVKAFPVVYAFLIDEGVRIRWHKLWDNLYGLEAMTSVEIVRSRKIAADTAVINISNIYRGFTDRPKSEMVGSDSRLKQTLWPSLTEEMKEVHNTIAAPLGLFPGARLHIRMGYGNNLSELPIIFNGTVTEVDVRDIVTLVAQGDAIELTNILNFPDGKTSGFMNTGSEPKNLLEKLLMWGDSESFALLFRQAKNFVWGDMKNPVVHFGSPEVKLFGNSGEIGQNIYPGNKTGVPEGESVFRAARHLYCPECATYVEAVLKYSRAKGTSKFKRVYKCPNDHDIPHGIYDCGGDEVNVEISLSKKTVWDIAQILASAVPNYIASVQPFDFRSTLFYGKPWWDIVYSYALCDRERPGVVKTKAGFYLQPKTKPFMQWHIYTSYGHIIDNRIKASSDGVFTNVIVQMKADQILGKRGAEIAPVTVFADKDIDPHIQKTTIIDSQLYSRAPYPFDPIFSRTIEMVGRIIGGERNLWSIGASTVRDFLKDMYRGELVVIGDPTIKPHDAMYIGDVYNEMFGTCFVEQVIHTFSAETGFITSITPDAAVTVQDHEALNMLIWGGGCASTALGAWLIKTMAIFGLKNAGVLAGTVGGFLAKVGTMASSAKLAAVFGTAAKGASFAASAMETLSTALIAGGTAPILLLLVTAVIVGWCLFSKFERYLKSAQCVNINLLTHHGKEFSAGINGHRGITVGSAGPYIGKYKDLWRNLLPPWMPLTPADYELERRPHELFGSSLAMSFEDEVNERAAYETKGLTLVKGVKIVYRQGKPYPATPDDEDLLKSFSIDVGGTRRDAIGGQLVKPDHLDLLALAMIMEVSAQTDQDRLLIGSAIVNKLMGITRYKSVYSAISELGCCYEYQRLNPQTNSYEFGRFFEFSEVSIRSLELASAAIKEDVLARRSHFIDLEKLDFYLPLLEKTNGKAWKVINGFVYAYDKRVVNFPQSEITEWINNGAVLLTKEELFKIKEDGGF